MAYTAKEIKELVGDAKHAAGRTELRERWDTDYGLWRNEDYKGDLHEGEMEYYTSCLISSMGNKCINSLSNSDKKIWIPITDESEKERTVVAKTERFCHGGLRLAEKNLTSAVEPGILDSMAWHACNRGYVIPKLLLRVDKEGTVIFDFDIKDAYDTYWGIGSDRKMQWICFERWGSYAQLKEEYGDKEEFGAVSVSSKSKKSISVLAFCTKDAEYTVIGDSIINTYQHKLGHIPAGVFLTTATPTVHSEKYDDTLKDKGESVYANVRKVAVVISRVMSYYLEAVAMSVQTPLVALVKGGKLQVDKNPRELGDIWVLDADKVVDVRELIKPEMTQSAMALFQMMMREFSIGGISPVAYGYVDSAYPVGTTNILTHEATTIMKPALHAMQDALSWVCNEMIWQYKRLKDVGDLYIQGVDNKRDKFSVKIKADDIQDETEVEVELVPDVAMDEMQNAQIASQLVGSGIISKLLARDRYAKIDDPEGEEERINYETVSANPEYQLRKALIKAKEDKDQEAMQVISDMLAQLTEQKMAARQAQMPSQGMNPQLRGQMRATTNMPNVPSGMGVGNVPENVRTAIRSRRGG